MRIPVASAVGTGPNELVAFDRALYAAGVANRNLIYLSSVIPPGARIDQVSSINHAGGDWGDRLFCVMSRHATSTPGEWVWAGIGWAQSIGDKRGLFVEHHAGDEPALTRLIDQSLDELCKTRGMWLPQRGIEVVGARCDTEPVCAIAVAVFETVPWYTRFVESGM